MMPQVLVYDTGVFIPPIALRNAASSSPGVRLIFPPPAVHHSVLPVWCRLAAALTAEHDRRVAHVRGEGTVQPAGTPGILCGGHSSPSGLQGEGTEGLTCIDNDYIKRSAWEGSLITRTALACTAYPRAVCRVQCQFPS